jgi:hypothetical protein
MPFVAKVMVIPEPGASAQVAAPVPREFGQPDIDRIAIVIQQSIIALESQLAQPSPEPKTFGLSELEVKFGIDLQGESKIPLVGPLLGIGVKAGATFQVTITLAKSA